MFCMMATRLRRSFQSRLVVRVPKNTVHLSPILEGQRLILITLFGRRPLALNYLTYDNPIGRPMTPSTPYEHQAVPDRQQPVIFTS